MENQVFKPGDVVFHKANNLRMVVMEVEHDFITCRFITASGIFYKDTFHSFELTDSSDTDIKVLTQLEGRKKD